MLNFLAILNSGKDEKTPPEEEADLSPQSEYERLLEDMRRRDGVIRELEDQNKRLQDELEEKRQQIKKQEQIIEELKEELRLERFGKKTEKRKQPSSPEEAPPPAPCEEDPPTTVPEYVSELAKTLRPLNKEKKKNRAKAKRNRNKAAGKAPAHIPTRVTYTVLPTIGNLCPYCQVSLGAPLKQEESVKLCKCRYRVERIVMYRVSSLCRACGTFFYSSTSEDPFPKSRFDESFVADVVTQKFVDGVPLHRQAQALERDDIFVSEDTLEEFLLKGAATLKPTYRYHRDEVKKSALLACDQTPLSVKVTGEDGVSRYVQGSLSLSANLEGEVVLIASADQKKESCEKGIGNKVKILVSDAAPTYASIAHSKGIEEANCLSHARRKFFKARQADPVLADQALDFFAALYAVEAIADVKEATAEERQLLRQEQAKPVLNDFRKWCEKVTEIRDKGEKIREAVDYMLTRWEKFEKYLEDGRIPIDTNGIERTMKLIARARKNFLHCSSLEGAEACALFFSLIFTCLNLDINPVVYLADVLKRAAATKHDQHKALIPRLWKEERAKELERKAALCSPPLDSAALAA